MNTVENINKVKRIRGYGEGSVYQRKDGRWVGKYKDEKMLKPRYVYGKTEAEARRKLREFKKTIVHGITDCRKVLLSTYIERWLYTFKAAAVENTSFDRLESVYYTHIKPTLGGFQLGNIKAVDIQTLLNQKSTEYSYTIVKMIRQILSEVFQHAYTEGDILKNPMANVIMAKRSKFKPERKMLILEDAEVKRLEEAAREKYGTGRPLFVHGNLIVFMLHTGLRCGDDDDKIRLNQRKPSKYKGLSRFGPEKNLQRINKFMKERPTFYKKLIQMKENFRFYLRCFYCITKVVILQFNSEKQDRISS